MESLDEALRSTSRHTGGALGGVGLHHHGRVRDPDHLQAHVPFQQMGQVTVYAVGLSLAAAILVLPSLLALWERWHRRREAARAT